MRKITKDELFYMSKVPRLNLVNCVTGYKSANLIGTCSENGTLNVAIFSSVTHLGSEPPLLGFILRPTTVPRDTYKNIKEIGIFYCKSYYRRNDFRCTSYVFKLRRTHFRI